MIIDLILKYQEDGHISVEDLNSFKENEGLDSLSQEQLKTRLEKSLDISVEQVGKILKGDLTRENLVRLSHFAIDIAEKSGSSNQTKRKASVGSSSSKKPKVDDTTVSLKRKVIIFISWKIKSSQLW